MKPLAFMSFKKKVRVEKIFSRMLHDLELTWVGSHTGRFLGTSLRRVSETLTKSDAMRNTILPVLAVFGTRIRPINSAVSLQKTSEELPGIKLSSGCDCGGAVERVIWLVSDNKFSNCFGTDASGRIEGWESLKGAGKG